ncbi:contractile injection system protein, VgrG/Pvc8 family [Asticcacaulis sp. BYS171W]|uniref:Contractile injection system protein, VgrG/Pvc8 family n=1 Tax=Asticcacaulis aquaticus TaxID=2984212 RepID=A0ABT5HT68_9CAUL|nr:contractile injection system protein, VgrG/Pvc8 family [Asticcacaulis aquaticus]MDC7683263.1 contractile injection system protein, VgrG/Pvc8 family [Asticcacaulis aquaticus]
MPIAAWQVTLDGVDLTARLAPRLIALTLTEKRGNEADQLDIEINDSDGALTMPKKGAVLTVALGWLQGDGLPLGLIDKGKFKVDEVKWKDNPDGFTITARSADFTDEFSVKRERSFVGKTVADIIGTIAVAHGLKPLVHPALAPKIVKALGGRAMSDAARLKALGKTYDAVATVKAGNLLFAPIGNGQSATGKGLPALAFDRRDTSPGQTYEEVAREDYGGVTAVWHDQAKGQQKKVTIGAGTTSKKPKRLGRVYHSEAAATQAAQAEYTRTARAKAKMSFSLALGRPDAFPNRPVTLTGWKTAITAHIWVIVECSHKMDGQGGLTTALQLESN